MAKRSWSVNDLTTLARARANRLTYPEIRDEFFPERTVASVRSAAQTTKYSEVEDAVETAPDIYVEGGDGPARYEFPAIGVMLGAEAFAKLVRLYVNEGEGKTRMQVARELGLTTAQMDHICRVYGLTKDSPSIPREALARMTDERAVQRVMEAREDGIAQKVQDSRAKYFERKYRRVLHKLQDQETVIARIDRHLAERSDAFGASPGSIVYTAPAIHAVHIPLADVHAGKLSWAPETGADYDSVIACERIKRHGAWATEILHDLGGVDTAYVTDVGDFFHAILSETESGTALDKDTRDMKVFDLTFEAKVQQIEDIRSSANKVVVMNVPGNHDHIFAALFSRMLRLHYQGCTDVEVREVYGRYAGFVVGETAHLLDHGKGVGSLSGWKAKAQLRTVRKLALDSKELDKVRRDVYYVGHLHELQVGSHTDAELRRLFPLCEPDDFEVSLRFTGEAGAEMFSLDERGRIMRIDRFFPEEERTGGLRE